MGIRLDQIGVYLRSQQFELVNRMNGCPSRSRALRWERDDSGLAVGTTATGASVRNGSSQATPGHRQRADAQIKVKSADPAIRVSERNELE